MFLRRVFTIRGFTLMKIILYSYYWDRSFKKAVHILGKGGSRL